ncbi:MAG: TIGR03790 family protein [Armatimonadetes bacterium]|nr:TIGR03790 family protein [Armatimonadota bacterium]
MRCFRLSLIAALLILLEGFALAIGRPENVLVVRNGASPVSTSIASYYMAQRGIPAGNLVTISTVDSSLSSANESIALQNYLTQIEQPIRMFLSNSGLANQVQFIVLTKGVPHRLSSDPDGGKYGGRSVDSVLSSIDLVDQMRISFGTDGGIASINRYWRATEPFTHAAYGGYLVTRLDGYTESDAKALVDRSLATPMSPLYALMDAKSVPTPAQIALQPKSLLLPDGTFDTTYNFTYSDYDADMAKAAQVIAGRPQLSVTLDTAAAFIGSPNPLTAYISWGSNDGNFSEATYHSLMFGPGSIAETAVSTSGRTFLPTTGGQSLMADLISQGVAGVKCYATEPYLDSIASPTVLMDLYTSGRNLAESYYAASRFVQWKDVMIGDPLCALSGDFPTTIPAAKAMADGSLVSLDGVVVTAGTDVFGDKFYVEDTHRASGLQVRLGKTFSGITAGMTVSVRGIIQTDAGERYVANASVVY